MSTPAFRHSAAALLGAILWAGCQPAPSDALFTELKPETSGVSFANRLPEQTPDGMNIIQYLYYYNGGGVAVGDIDNDGLPDLYFTSNLESNRLYRNKGNLQFEDITEKAGVGGSGSWKTGATMADVNADGWLDIYVCQVGHYKSFRGKNQLFINNHDGTFTERAAEYGLDLQAFCTQAAFFDYDLDHRLDCFVLCHSVHSAARFRDTSLTRKYDPLAADRLLRGDGQAFQDVSQALGIYGGSAGYGLGLAVGDFDLDGYPDIYVGNDFHENDYLYFNRAGRHFDEKIAGTTGHTSNFTMGCDLADINNDARPDLISLDMQPADEVLLKASQPADEYNIYQYKHTLGYHWQLPHNCLQLNLAAPDGTPYMSEVAYLAGVAATDWSWSSLLADFDLDGWKDLFISNGILRRPNDLDYLKFISSAEAQRQATDLQLIEKMPAGAAPNYGFRNRGDGRFEDVSRAWGLAHTGCSNGAACADLDNDGDLDLVVNNLNEPASILRNNASGAAFLKIRLHGANANTFGIGARAWCWSGNKVQYAENQPVRGFQSSVEPGLLLFGLGQSQQVDSLRVEWPGGKTTTLLQPKPNQTLDIFEKDARAPQHAQRPAKPLFRSRTLPFEYQEPVVQDNTLEKLLPWMPSTTGPKIAAGDVNADGRTDLVVPHYPPLLQQADGAFRPGTPLQPATADSIQETALALFDADGDGDLDLYQGSGSYPAGPAERTLPDRLYANDGRGRFSEQPNALPQMLENTACVRPADVDNDGDADLFVGARSAAGAYGIAARSYLLLNDGHGHFTAGNTSPWNALGMVSDAQWTDVDGDRRPDLVVCGEWMPLTILHNTGTGFERLEIPHSTGLWNSLAVADVDGDGDVDLLAGNFGLNSILRATEKEPLGLWVKDIDHNGSFDPIVTYYRQGANRVFADKDWLVSQLPGVKKRYVEYRKYAESTFEEVFPAGLLKDAVYRKAEVLESCLVENRGTAGWALHPLPAEAQVSPVFALLPGDFDADGHLDVLLGGNFYDVQPAIGRQDASAGVLLRGDGRGGFTAVAAAQSGFWLRGAMRDLHLVSGANGRRQVVAAAHNGPVWVFE